MKKIWSRGRMIQAATWTPCSTMIQTATSTPWILTLWGEIFITMILRPSASTLQPFILPVLTYFQLKLFHASSLCISLDCCELVNNSRMTLEWLQNNSRITLEWTDSLAFIQGSLISNKRKLEKIIVENFFIQAFFESSIVYNGINSIIVIESHDTLSIQPKRMINTRIFTSLKEQLWSSDKEENKFATHPIFNLFWAQLPTLSSMISFMFTLVCVRCISHNAWQFTFEDQQ